MSLDLDALIDDAVVWGELSAGTNATWLAGQTDARRVAVMANAVEARVGKAAAWTPAEDAYLRENYMTLSDEELGYHLGRSADGVHIRRERHLRLPARSTSHDWPNVRAVARMLGVPCQKMVQHWVEQGLLRKRKLPLQNRTHVIHRPDVLRFAVNPRNWVYFRPERVRDPQIRRLVDLRRVMWGDVWWSPGQVAAYHGVSLSAVNKYIHLGQLPAVRWYNWHILRSDAVAFPFRQGRKNWNQPWTERADAFLILGRAIGFSWSDLDILTGKPHTDARVAGLWRKGMVAAIVERHGLAVQVDPVRKRLYADWRQWQGRFPFLDRAVARFCDGRTLTASESRLLLGVMEVWLSWHAATDEQREVARRLKQRSCVRTDSVIETYAQLVGWGFSLER